MTLHFDPFRGDVPPLVPNATDYSHAEVAAARDRIAAAFPNAVFETWDYGFGLGVMVPGGTPVIVFQPERRREDGSVYQSTIVADVDGVIEHMLRAT